MRNSTPMAEPNLKCNSSDFATVAADPTETVAQLNTVNNSAVLVRTIRSRLLYEYLKSGVCHHVGIHIQRPGTWRKIQFIFLRTGTVQWYWTQRWLNACFVDTQ